MVSFESSCVTTCFVLLNVYASQYAKCMNGLYFFRPHGLISVKQLQLQLQQSQQLADNYREQCISMEEEVCKLKEQVGASKNLFKQRTEKVAKRLSLMNSRYEALEERRCLEIEGYKNDIKLLRQRLKDVEKQLFKVSVRGSIVTVICRLVVKVNREWALASQVVGHTSVSLICTNNQYS